MQRRTLIAAGAAITTTGIAGCLGETPTSGPSDGDPDESDDSPDSTPEGTYLADQSFEVERVECGSEYGDHEVTTEDGVITVEGILDGSNGCYTAELVTAEYDADADELYVEVESVDGSDEGEMCTQCIVEIEYVATFTFENDAPANVRVDQRGVSTGSSSSSGSASASEPDGGNATQSESQSGSGESTPEPTDS